LGQGASIRKYPWAEMQPRLDAASGATAEARYHLRGQSNDISKTVGASALRIDAGAKTKPVRETSSAVMHVYEGSGRSQVGDTTIEWSQGDTFAVPAWLPVVHENPGSKRVYLFQFDDRPLLNAIGAYRREDA
jgi:gentisate 1,2-dioxygenase